MTVKIKFLNPVSQEKFLHNLVNAKKKDSNYKHSYHKLLEEAKSKASFRISDEEGKIIVSCEIDFYPDENLVDIEVHPCDFDKFQALVLATLEGINEKAFIRFIDIKFFYNGGNEFFVLSVGGKRKIYKLSVDRDRLLDVEAYHIPMEIKEGSVMRNNF